ncbi:hypothetical protein NOJ28_21185 [Neorhizobium galegae]|uniref:hypothetical protein n=1 Tax=Neorhizobium galegae TaxID=399 RepID=UPI0021050371|nr:hypothetical protein [Neorhizobium galegae]MCQ1768060.1 hypothetical protein [Neorhizobium galegae]MCQ1848568.1 hypothetical protein [Neorhizobium galegae]
MAKFDYPFTSLHQVSLRPEFKPVPVDLEAELPAAFKTHRKKLKKLRTRDKSFDRNVFKSRF